MGRIEIKKVVEAGIYAIAALVPFSLIIRVATVDKVVFVSKVPFVDMAIWVIFLLWIFDTIRKGRIGKIRLMPPPLFILFVFALLSVIASDTDAGSLKEFVQLFDYFVLLFILIINNIETKRQIGILIDILCAVTAITVCYAVYQYHLFGGRPYMVRATFENRNVFNAYLSITTPILFGMLLIKKSRISAILYGIVIVGGLAVVTSLAAFVTLFITFSVLGVLATRKFYSILAVLVIFAVLTVAPVSVGIAEFGGLRYVLEDAGSRDEYRDKLEKTAQMSYHERIAVSGVEKYAIHFFSDMVPVRKVPNEFMDDQVNARIKYVMYGDGGHVNQRFIEWFAAMSVLDDKPLLGVGIGNYYSKIGFYYYSLPKINTIEPETQNGYLVTLSTMGLFGFGALIWIIMHFFKMVAASFVSLEDPFERGLALGLLGSLGTGIIINNFYPLIYKAPAVPFVFVLGLIYVLAADAAGNRDEPVSSREIVPDR